MLDFSLPHRRLNPLNGDWVLVSPHRAKRPWKGTVEASQALVLPEYDSTCYLCPGNKRSNEMKNPQYSETYVFTNDHSSLLPEAPDGIYTEGDHLIHTQQERGICRVICYSPSHKLTMADMTEKQILTIITTWIREYQTIGAMKDITHVQIFENKGPLMGASSPHPHGQIWATGHLPTIIQKEQTMQQMYFAKHKTPLLLTYLKLEKHHERIIFENNSFTLLVPFWATWPYETMIIPKKHRTSLASLTSEEQHDLSVILKRLTQGYDALFSTPFPYSMGIHQAPTDESVYDEWQLHFHFYPPLLRSATIKKYFVGYEMFAEAQRDINPEDAAKTLKNLI